MAVVTLPWEEARRAAAAALEAHGASPEHAAATGESILSAQAEGARALGFAHLFAYCEALTAGRARGAAAPVVEPATPALTRVDAARGLPHLGVERGWPALVAAAESLGVGVLALRNGYTCGALGYFARRLAQEHGLAALVAANAGPAVMPVSGGARPSFCTNPLAFAVPCPEGGPIVIDQSSSAAALVRIRQAAEEGRPIPDGWALDRDGAPTNDPAAALAGALLPFGGARGANIALMVELLAAGLTGGAWSFEAPPYHRGAACPGAGLLILAFAPERLGGEFDARMRRFLAHVQAEPAAYLPGLDKGARRAEAHERGVAVERALWRRVQALALGPAGANAVDAGARRL